MNYMTYDFVDAQHAFPGVSQMACDH